MMDASSTFVMFGDSATTMLSLLVFLATGTLAFAVMVGIRAREAVRRRAVRVNLDEEARRWAALAAQFGCQRCPQADRLCDQALLDLGQ